MQETRRPWFVSGVATILIVLSIASGLVGFLTEATYSFAVVGSFYWLGLGILSALLAVALLLSSDGRR